MGHRIQLLESIMKNWLYIYLFLCCSNATFGQSDSLFAIVNQAQENRLKRLKIYSLDSAYDTLEAANAILLETNFPYRDLPDSNARYLLANELDTISNGTVLAYAFMNHVVITNSGSVGIYSWDDLDRGTYHTYRSFVVYTNSLGECVKTEWDTGSTAHEAGYHRLYQIEDHYLAFGYGTYGGGQQHFLVKVFNLLNDSIHITQEIFIPCNRSQKVELTYDSKNQTLSYLEYVFDEGFYTSEFQVIELKYMNGTFVKM